LKLFSISSIVLLGSNTETIRQLIAVNPKLLFLKVGLTNYKTSEKK